MIILLSRVVQIFPILWKVFLCCKTFWTLSVGLVTCKTNYEAILVLYEFFQNFLIYSTVFCCQLNSKCILPRSVLSLFGFRALKWLMKKDSNVFLSFSDLNPVIMNISHKAILQQTLQKAITTWHIQSNHCKKAIFWGSYRKLILDIS